MSRRRKRQPAPVDPAPAATPSDEAVARDMAQFADAFLRGTTAEGHILDYDGKCADRLDELATLFLQSNPSSDVLDSMTLAMGAYLGELIIRNGGGTWTYELSQESPGVRLPRSTLVGFPLNKVYRRLTIGPEHSLKQFYDAAVTGQLPPEARIVNSPS
jgi:hypothetical protein